MKYAKLCFIFLIYIQKSVEIWNQEPNQKKNKNGKADLVVSFYFISTFAIASFVGKFICVE